MATEEDVNQTIARFAQNFEFDGFIVFDSSASINFVGSLLLNYKGLRIIRFHKTQLMGGQFSQPEFHEICDKNLTSAEKREDVFKILKERYPQCSICAIGGGIFRSAGELAVFKKGDVTFLIY